MDKAHTFLETRTEEVLRSPSFTDISCATLIRILRFDKLTVSELDMFQVRKVLPVAQQILHGKKILTGANPGLLILSFLCRRRRACGGLCRNAADRAWN